MPCSEASPLKTLKIFLIFTTSEHSWNLAALVGMLRQPWPSLQSEGFLAQGLGHTLKQYYQIMLFLSLGKGFSSSV